MRDKQFGLYLLELCNGNEYMNFLKWFNFKVIDKISKIFSEKDKTSSSDKVFLISRYFNLISFLVILFKFLLLK
ncbi:hypothetical protein [Chryseobacterium taklimakanense]|uniref:hypothetical protein n=1 Tax=Chryseobacterium taklimakanense TaxID=536441 RepID=UPI001E2A7420|nr:hypothetical protein [Chryseobacterium taklimakanense]